MNPVYVDLYAHHSRRKGNIPTFLLRPYLRVFGFPYLSDRWRHSAALAALKGTTLRDARVLDAGCGMGWFSLILSRDYGAQVTGVDIDPEWTGKAAELAKTFGYSAKFENRDLLGLADDYKEQFDGVVALDVLEHIQDDEGLLRVFACVSRPDAFLLMAVPTLHRRVIAEREHGFGHVRKGYDEGMLRVMLEHAGYQVESARYADPCDIVYWSFRMPDLLAYLSFPVLYLLMRLTNRGKVRQGGILLTVARKSKEPPHET